MEGEMYINFLPVYKIYDNLVALRDIMWHNVTFSVAVFFKATFSISMSPYIFFGWLS